MITFERETLKKMTMPQLKEILEYYKKAGFEPTLEPQNNPDRVHAILEVMDTAGGYPHEVTAEWLAENEMPEDSELKIGDVVIVPFPTPEEAMRDGAMHDAEALYDSLGLTPEEAAVRLEELEALPTEELVTRVRAEMKLAQAPSEIKETPASTPAPTAPVGEGTDLIRAAIKSGLVMHEGRVIIDYRTKIAFGKTRYELYATDGATYTVTSEELEAIIDRA